jgi:hypothetical protein
VDKLLINKNKGGDERVCCYLYRKNEIANFIYCKEPSEFSWEGTIDDIDKHYPMSCLWRCFYR